MKGREEGAGREEQELERGEKRELRQRVVKGREGAIQSKERVRRENFCRSRSERAE